MNTRGWSIWLLALAIGLSPYAARAETMLSGFGALGGAISDQDFMYQRFINDEGTLSRDSIVGLQLDQDLSNAWRATVQGTFGPSDTSDSAWAPNLTWAFLSWRPSNDLLLRFGKLRLPLLLYSENADVGVTFDFARLPTEVYSMMPTTNVVGAFANKTWLQGDREWTLEGYAGRGHAEYRYFLRQGLGVEFPTGPWFVGIDLDMFGLVGALRQNENRLSLGLHHGALTSEYGRTHADFPYIPIMPGIGYYLFGEGTAGEADHFVNSLDLYLATFGAQVALPREFRLIGEFARRRITNAKLGPDAHAGYLAVLKSVGRWTPYAYWSYIRSSDSSLDLAVAMNKNRVPAFIPSADLINTTQTLGSDLMSAYDQQSFALGASCQLSPTSKLKAEWMHTQSGRLSSFIDAPANQDSGRRQVNVFSLSYSFVF